MGPEETPEEYAEQAEVKDVSGLRCFMSDDRACGASCMAYVTYPHAKANNSDLEEQNLHCAVISNIERAGRALSIVSQIGHSLLKLKKTCARWHY